MRAVSASTSTRRPACVSICASAVSGASRPVSWYLPIRATMGKYMASRVKCVLRCRFCDYMGPHIAVLDKKRPFVESFPKIRSWMTAHAHCSRR
ncbi:Uncharacterised protein [Bordetella pertussis]|nr:Uncharacterised protein [Bordetella pertussis]